MKTIRKSKILIAVALLCSLLFSLTLFSCTQSGSSEKPNTDREGNPITLPDKIEKIITLGPSNTETVAGLGLADKIIAIDTYSTDVPGLTAGIPAFDMMAPDAEQITALQPDVIFVTGMAQVSGDDPYKPIKDAGICVIYIPSSSSIDGIKEDIKYYANVLDVKAKGDSIIKDMETKISDIKKIGDTIADGDKKSVYFEISAAPYMYSFGKGVFLNEMLDIIGVKNILADESGWVSVADETVLSKNPDVIMTTVNYVDNPTEEIKSRPGWDSIGAVANGEVYYIDTNSSNRPNQNIVKALEQIAKTVYPDKYN
jgi:iron complex transport system substrate-binding protein